MADDADAGTFGERFMAFFEGCSAEEQSFLSWVFSAELEGGEATPADGDVTGFGLGSGGGPPALGETQMSFNLQYLQLQSQMQHENRSYTAVSNIMQSKKRAVDASLGLIR